LVDRSHSVKRYLTSNGHTPYEDNSGNGTSIAHMLPTGIVETVQEKIDKVFDSLKPYEEILPDGGGRWFTVRIYPYQTMDGQIDCLSVSLFDSTEKKVIEQELAEKEKEIVHLKRLILMHEISERWRVGSFLHDELSQLLFVADLMIHDLYYDVMNESIDYAEKSKILSEKFGDISSVLKQAGESTRNLSHDILPMDIESNEVVEAFANLCRRTEQLHQVDCRLEGKKVLGTINDSMLATNLYHIANEAIKNAVKHTDSDSIRVRLKTDNQHIHLTIEDNGKPPTGQTDKKQEGMGISIMRYRAELMGGTLNLTELKDSQDFKTCLTCIVPVNPQR